MFYFSCRSRTTGLFCSPRTRPYLYPAHAYSTRLYHTHTFVLTPTQQYCTPHTPALTAHVYITRLYHSLPRLYCTPRLHTAHANTFHACTTRLYGSTHTPVRPSLYPAPCSGTGREWPVLLPSGLSCQLWPVWPVLLPSGLSCCPLAYPANWPVLDENGLSCCPLARIACPAALWPVVPTGLSCSSLACTYPWHRGENGQSFRRTGPKHRDENRLSSSPTLYVAPG